MGIGEWRVARVVMRIWVVLALVFFNHSAYAATYHAGSDCAPLQTYTPSPDVEARPGYDQHGNAVASPDLQGSTMDTEALKHPNIALDMPLPNYLKEDKYNGDFSRSDIQVGNVKVGEQGEVTMNGQILSTGQQAVYPKECK